MVAMLWIIDVAFDLLFRPSFLVQPISLSPAAARLNAPDDQLFVTTRVNWNTRSARSSISDREVMFNAYARHIG